MKFSSNLSFVLSTLLICSLGFGQTQNATHTKATSPQKLKKVKIDLSKKSDVQNIPTLAPAPVKLTPVYKTNSVVAAETVSAPEQKPVSFSFIYNSSYSRLAEKQDDGSTGDTLQHEIVPGIKVGNYSFMGDFIYNDDLKNPSQNEWQDSALIASRKALELGQFFTLSPAAIMGLPLSKRSREVVSLKYALSASAALGLNTKNMSMDSWSLNYSLGYTKFVTEFETNTSGEPNPNYRIRQRLNLGYNFTENLSFKTRFQFDSVYSNANVVRNSYVTFQVFEYRFNEHFSANMGHSNGANAFNIIETPQDYNLENNIKLYDPKTSNYSVGISLSI